MSEQIEKNERDPTLDLKETAEKSREELDSFLGNQDTISGKMDEKLGEYNVGEDGKKRSMSSTNADYQPTIEHIGKASNITGTGQFNLQNKILIVLGTLLALALLVPITSYIMIFDLKQIISGFSLIYQNYTFTITLAIGSISFIIVLITEFLFLGQFNKKNKETRTLEKIILWILLFIQFGSHAYFAYLITGVKNVEKKVQIMESNSSTEGILTKGLSNSSKSIASQLETLQKELKNLQDRAKKVEAQKEHYAEEWEKLNALKSPTRQQVRQRRNFYTQQQSAKKELKEIQKDKDKTQDKIDKLTDKSLSISSKISKISTSLDKELDESGFWRIIYIILLLLLFEGLSHINWLAYYRIIKNAPDDLQEDYRELSYVLNWGKTFANKTKEAIAIIAGQQIRMADEQLNNVKMTSKAFEYQNSASSALMIESTRANVASLTASTGAMRKTTQATLYLAKTIDKSGFENPDKDDLQKLNYEPNSKIVESKTLVPPKMLVDALEYISQEFTVTVPSLALRRGAVGGEFDIIENQIVIGELETEKLSVLAHEFTHFLGYMAHSKEFKDMEEVVFKGLEQWYKSKSSL